MFKKLITSSLAAIPLATFSSEPRFHKLDAAGSKLPDSAEVWDAVYDTQTKLYWEVKTDDGSPRDFNETYFWGGDNIPNYEGIPKQYGNWDTLVSYVNESKLCGFNDWRVPNISELKTLTTGVKGKGGKSWKTHNNPWGTVFINPNYFPHVLKMNAPFFWSVNFYESGAYGLGFQSGIESGVLIDDMGSRVMLVRSSSQS